jgi:hypothetical protein
LAVETTPLRAAAEAARSPHVASVFNEDMRHAIAERKIRCALYGLVVVVRGDPLL